MVLLGLKQLKELYISAEVPNIQETQLAQPVQLAEIKTCFAVIYYQGKIHLLC